MFPAYLFNAFRSFFPKLLLPDKFTIKRGFFSANFVIIGLLMLMEANQFSGTIAAFSAIRALVEVSFSSEYRISLIFSVLSKVPATQSKQLSWLIHHSNNWISCWVSW